MVHNSIMSPYKNTILSCLSLLGLLILTQCTQKADNKNSEQENTGMLDDNNNPPSDPAASLDKALSNTKPVNSKIDARLIGDFNLFSTNIDSNDHPVYGEQNIDMKCRWNADGTIIRNTAGIEQRGTWSVVDDSLLVVRIDSLYQTKGSFVIEPPAYDTSIIQQCDDHHLILTSSSNGYTSTITWVRRPE